MRFCVGSVFMHETKETSEISKALFIDHYCTERCQRFPKYSMYGWFCIHACDSKFLGCFFHQNKDSHKYFSNFILGLSGTRADFFFFLSLNSHVEWLIWKYAIIWQQWTYIFLLGIRDKLYYFTSLEQLSSPLPLSGVRALFREFYTPNHLIQ